MKGERGGLRTRSARQLHVDVFVLRLVITAVVLQVVAQAVHFGKHEVYVGLLNGLVGYDAAEKVGVLAQRLVTDHDRTGSHHPALQLSRHLKKKRQLLIRSRDDQCYR